MNTKERAIAALASAVNSVNSKAVCDSEGYVIRPEDNFLPGITGDLFEEEFGGAAGGEMGGPRPKMAAAYSSSALVVNAFAPWKRSQDRLTVAGLSGFESLQFEQKCPTGLRGTPPHLDVIAHRNDAVVAIESKCLEYLDKHSASFSPAYRSIDDSRSRTGWFKELLALADGKRTYRHLDAAQLIKHYLGVSRTFKGIPVTLLYLYWEPMNWDEYPEFRRHRDEIDEFADRIAGSDVAFTSKSHFNLWEEWSRQSEPGWLREHLAHLRARYAVVI